MVTAVTLQFQSTGSIPGSGEPVAMRGTSMTIGRGDENDVVLPDPDRVLSKRHCAIEDHNGNIVVVDLSTNGTFLNYGKLALGNLPTPLNNGDILTVGPYEIMVSFAEAGAQNTIAAPLDDGPVSHGFAANAPSAADLLDAPGDGGDFLDDLLSGRDQPVGPGGVKREEPDDFDGLLPPLGEDDPMLAPPVDPFAGQGASSAMHSPSGQDHFAAPQTTGGSSAIPDDWDDDFLKPTAQSGSPFSSPAATPAPSESMTGGAAFIPDDFGAENSDPLGGDDDPFDALLGEPHAPVSQGVAPPPVADVPAPPPIPPSVAPETVTPEAPAPVVASAAGNQDAARAFLKSLGASEVKLSEEEVTPTLSRLGHVLRIMIEGMREILMTRTSIKSEFRIEQTMIQAGGNNPLKFSISPEQAIEAMVRPSSKGYLDAADAAAQALQDIKAHEVAMITGMESALKGILNRLDPAVLEEKITVSGGLGSVLKSKKARYWEVYESMYAEISDQAENDFHELFAREFARAYQEQLDKLK